MLFSLTFVIMSIVDGILPKVDLPFMHPFWSSDIMSDDLVNTFETVLK
jgi:hypothetical protein